MESTIQTIKLQTVNEQRLWDSLIIHGQIGGTTKGGLNRLALTDLDRQGRDLFIQWCKEAGCSIEIDEIGNIFARRAGTNNQLPPVMIGSHIDTQPTGGKFDGCFGVMSGLEVVRRLNELKIKTEAPIEVVAWTNEEGARFAPCMMGSGVFTGKITLKEALETKDSEGISAGEALQSIGFNGTKNHKGHNVKAYFEAHIEQGPILEDKETQVGIVIGALGQKWFNVEIIGQEAHAGPTPMYLRKDAGLAGAELLTYINQLAVEYGPHGRGTVGCFDVYPSSRNVIPGKVSMTIDLRHLYESELDAMVKSLIQKMEMLQTKYGVDISFVPTADFLPVEFNDECVNSIRNMAEGLCFSYMDIVSGAGHDAIFLSEVTPTGMIFVPCENGISHNELERADKADLAAGASVLLNTVLKFAGRVKDD